MAVFCLILLFDLCTEGDALDRLSALAEVSVGAVAEATAGLDFSNRFELASNCRKDGYYAKR
jgi:hypothetical protein